MSWPAPTGEPIRPDGGGPSAVPGGQLHGQPLGTQPQSTQPGPARLSPPQSMLPPTAVQPAQTMPMPAQPPVPGQGGTGSAPVSPGAIATVQVADATSSGLARMNDRTGQPVRPWTIWVSAALMFGGAITVTVALLVAMWAMASPWVEVGDNEWTKVDKFNEATWLTAQFPSEPASTWRVFFAIVCCVIAVLVAGVASVIGYYAFAGYRWTRIGALVAVAVSLLSLLLSPMAAISIAFVALAAGPLWLPATKRFFARWHLTRHPQIAYAEPLEQVFYGPLPRYR